MLDLLSTPEAAPWSFEALYRQYGPRLLRTLRARCDDNLEEAKDLSQKIWQIVWRRSQELTFDHPWAFIEKVMKDEVNGRRRTMIRQREKLKELMPPAESSDPPELQERFPELWHCLDRLPPLDQEIVLAFYGIRRPMHRHEGCSTLRPAPPYLRVVSPRGFLLEVEEPAPPEPITDEAQAQALSKSLQEPWAPRRVRVRRSRALDGLKRCLEERGYSRSYQLSISVKGETHSLKTPGGSQNAASSPPSDSEDNSESRAAPHPPGLMLMLTAENPEHEAQQHLRRCPECQTSLAAVVAVENSLKALAQDQRERWQRAHEEDAALEDIWTRLQQSMASDEGQEDAETPEQEPEADPPSPTPAPPSLGEGRDAPDEECSSSREPLLPLRTAPVRDTTGVRPGRRFSLRSGLLAGMAIAATLLLAVNIPRPGADPLGLGNPTGRMRGSGEAPLFAPSSSEHETALEAASVGPESRHFPPSEEEPDAFGNLNQGGAFGGLGQGGAEDAAPAGAAEPSSTETSDARATSSSRDRLPPVGVRMSLAEGRSSLPIPLRRVPGQVDVWRGEYPLGATLRLTVFPPGIDGKRRSEQSWLKVTWSGTLDCSETDQEDDTRASGAAPAVSRMTWHQRPSQGLVLLLPLPPGPGLGGRLECRVLQTEDGGVLQDLRLVLTPVELDPSRRK